MRTSHRRVDLVHWPSDIWALDLGYDIVILVESRVIEGVYLCCRGYSPCNNLHIIDEIYKSHPKIKQLFSKLMMSDSFVGDLVLSQWHYEIR